MPKKSDRQPEKLRLWIKIWVGPWLDGTTRYEMSGSQRAFWVDLLALAARSRIAGVISPGQVNGKLLGYPLAFFQGFQPDLDVAETLKVFQSAGKIELIEGNGVAVKILNWDLYQAPWSGADRSKKYRENKKLGGV